MNIIFALSDYSIKVITSNKDWQSKNQYTDNEKQSNPFPKNISIHYLNTNESIIKYLGNDVTLYINGFYSWKYNILPILVKRNDVRIILAPTGMLKESAINLKSWKKRPFLYIAKSFKFYRNVEFHATNEMEKEEITRVLGSTGKIHVIDVLPKMKLENYIQTKKSANNLKLIYFSRISPVKNLLFLLKCLGTVSKKASIGITIVGESDDTSYLAKCKEQINLLPANITVTLLPAFSNEHIHDFYSNHHVFILPTLGENYGHAIAEAFISGKPVVISDQTPWRNLEERGVGFDLPLSDPQAWINAIEFFAAMDQEEYDKWSYRAWEYGREIQKNAEGLKEEYLNMFANQK